MADNTIVTEIIVDARSAQAGTALFIESQRAAQAAIDRTIDRHLRATEAQEKQVATMVRAGDTTSKLARQWEKLQASIDPATAANIKYQKSLEQITIITDHAVTNLGKLKETTDRVAMAARTMAAWEFQEAGLQKAVAGYNKVNAEHERVAKSAADLRAQINPLGAAFYQLGKQLAENAALQRAGAISTTELAKANALAVDRFNNIERSMRSATTAGRSLSGEVTQLSFQINDVLTGIALGQSPFMIMAQQGGQIIQIVAAAKNSVLDMFVGVAKSAWAFLTPIRLVIGGLVTIGLTAVTAAASWQSAQRDITIALSGIGRATGASRGDINRIAGAGASIFGLSVSEAREFASAIAATGKVGVDAIEPLVKLGNDFAKTFGVSATEAAKTLATAFSDPIRGAQQLNERLGFLDAKTQEYIRSLVAQGDRQKAIVVLTEAIGPSLVRAAELTSIWARAWTAVSNAASNAYDSIGKALDRALGGGTNDEKIAQKLADLIALQQASRGASSFVMNITGAAARIEALQKEIQELRNIAKAESEASQAARDRARSLEAQPIIDNVTKEIQVRRDLEEKIKNLAEAMANPAFAQHTKDLQQAAVAAERLKSAEETLITPMQREAQQAKISLDAIRARSPAQQADIAARRKSLELAGQENSQSERDLQVQNAKKIAYGQAAFQLSETARERLLSATQAVQSSKLEINLVGKSIEEQTRLRLNIQARHQLEQEAARNRIPLDEAELARLQKKNEEQAKNAQLQALASIQNQIKFDKDTAFLTDEDVQIASALRGIYPDVATALNSVEANGMRAANALRSMRDGAVDFVKTFASGILDGKSAVESLTAALDNLAKKLLDAGINDLISGALSGNIAQAAIGVAKVAGAFLIDMFSDQTKAQQEAKKKLQEAQKQWGEMQDQFRDFISAMNGEEVGSLTSALRAAEKQMRDFVEAAVKAEDFQAARQAQEAFQKFRDDQILEFKATWEAMLQAFDLGLGLDNPFVTAAQKVRDLAKQLKGFITDAQTAFLPQNGGFVGNSALMRPAAGGPGPEEIARATAAVREYLITLIGGGIELSETQNSLLTLHGTAQQLYSTLQDLGMSAADAADAINRGIVVALAKLRAAFTDDLSRKINELSGRAFVNSITDLVAQAAQMRLDAASLGLDPSQISLFFSLAAQKIVDDAGLVGESFNDLLKIFPDLTGVIHESTKALEDQKRAEEERQRALDQTARGIVDYVNSLLGGQQSTLSPTARLAQAEATYNSQLTLAQGGNVDALGSITKYFEDYRSAARDVYASSSAYQNILNAGIAQLLALPAVSQSTDPVVVAIRDSILEQQTGNTKLEAVKTNTLNTVANLATTIGKFDTVISRLSDSITLLNTTVAALNLGNVKVDSSNALLEQIKVLNNTSAEQLNIIRTQFSGTTNYTAHPGSEPPTNPYFSTMAESLAKIAINTWAISWNTAVLAANIQPQVGKYGTYAEGGWIRGGIPGRDSVHIIGMQNEYMVQESATRALTARYGAGIMDTINAGNVPTNVISFPSMGYGANDNGMLKDILRELVEMRKDNGNQRFKIAQLIAEQCRLTGKSAESIIVALDEQTESMKSDERQARNNPRAA